MRSAYFSTMALIAAASAGPALAQAVAPATPATPAVAAAPSPCQAGITKGARNSLVALQAAVASKVQADIAAKLAAAQAAAKSNDDRCFVALLQVQAAVDAGDLKAAAAGIEAQLASGSVPVARVADLFENLGRLQFEKGAYADASSAFERSLALRPNSSGPVIMLAETRIKQNRAADAFPLYRKALDLENAAGHKPDENWYRRAVAMAHAARNPVAYAFARDWLTAYPSAKNWRDAIRVYAEVSGDDESRMVDLYRLQRLTRSLTGEADHARYAQALISKGFAGEAKAMLDESFASNAVDRTRPSIKSYYALASAQAAGDRASLDGQAKAALANSAAKPAMALGEAYFGYGDYAKAAAMFRAAKGKSGVDTELANLRIGMALAASGDKADAKTALALVTGPRADIARFWATYAATRP